MHNAPNLLMPDRILSDEASSWASGGQRRYATLHMLGVAAGLAAVILSLYIECPHCSSADKQGQIQSSEWRFG